MAAVLVCVAMGTVSAFMVKRWKNTDASKFKKAEVKCSVTQEIVDGETVITIKNTGDVAAYIRVQLVVNWWEGKDLYYVSATELEVRDLKGWIREGNTFYFTQPVEVGSTVSLRGVAEPATDITKSGEDTPATYTLEAFAEAVQAEPTNAAEELWKVKIDASGTIVSTQ